MSFFLAVNVEVGSDDDKNDQEPNEDAEITIPSIREMTQKMTEICTFLQSREVPEEVWNSFSTLEGYLSNISFSNRLTQTKISQYTGYIVTDT